MNILVALPAEQALLNKYMDVAEDATFTFCSEGEYTMEQLRQSDIIFGTVPLNLLMDLPRLKWIHLSMAGANDYIELVKRGVKVTVSSGAYGLAISEHMLGMLLMLMKRLHTYRDNQRLGFWNDEGNVKSIEGSTALVLGLGDIGGEFAKKCHKLGAYTIGVRRTIGMKPDYLDELHQITALNQLISRADIIAMSLPGGEETHHIIGKDELAIMKQGAILLNVGRGNAIDTEALADAVADGRISCGLDVTEPEPLPREHRLWYLKNAFISPHISGFFHLKQTLERIVEIGCENLGRYLRDEPLLNSLDPSTGYRELNNRA